MKQKIKSLETKASKNEQIIVDNNNSIKKIESYDLPSNNCNTPRSTNKCEINSNNADSVTVAVYSEHNESNELKINLNMTNDSLYFFNENSNSFNIVNNNLFDSKYIDASINKPCYLYDSLFLQEVNSLDSDSLVNSMNSNKFNNIFNNLPSDNLDMSEYTPSSINFYTNEGTSRQEALFWYYSPGIISRVYDEWLKCKNIDYTKFNNDFYHMFLKTQELEAFFKSNYNILEKQGDNKLFNINQVLASNSTSNTDMDNMINYTANFEQNQNVEWTNEHDNECNLLTKMTTACSAFSRSNFLSNDLPTSNSINGVIGNFLTNVNDSSGTCNSNIININVGNFLNTFKVQTYLEDTYIKQFLSSLYNSNSNNLLKKEFEKKQPAIIQNIINEINKYVAENNTTVSCLMNDNNTLSQSIVIDTNVEKENTNTVAICTKQNNVHEQNENTKSDVVNNLNKHGQTENTNLNELLNYAESLMSLHSECEEVKTDGMASNSFFSNMTFTDIAVGANNFDDILSNFIQKIKSDENKVESEESKEICKQKLDTLKNIENIYSNIKKNLHENKMENGLNSSNSLNKKNNNLFNDCLLLSNNIKTLVTISNENVENVCTNELETEQMKVDEQDSTITDVKITTPVELPIKTNKNSTLMNEQTNDNKLTNSFKCEADNENMNHTKIIINKNNESMKSLKKDNNKNDKYNMSYDSLVRYISSDLEREKSEYNISSIYTHEEICEENTCDSSKNVHTDNVLVNNLGCNSHNDTHELNKAVELGTEQTELVINDQEDSKIFNNVCPNKLYGTYPLNIKRGIIENDVSKVMKHNMNITVNGIGCVLNGSNKHNNVIENDSVSKKQNCKNIDSNKTTLNIPINLEVERYCIHSNDINSEIDSSNEMSYDSCNNKKIKSKKNAYQYEDDDYENEFGFNSEYIKQLEQANNFTDNYSNYIFPSNNISIDSNELVYKLKDFILQLSRKIDLDSSKMNDTLLIEFVNRYLENYNSLNSSLFNEVVQIDYNGQNGSSDMLSNKKELASNSKSNHKEMTPNKTIYYNIVDENQCNNLSSNKSYNIQSFPEFQNEYIIKFLNTYILDNLKNNVETKNTILKAKEQSSNPIDMHSKCKSNNIFSSYANMFNKQNGSMNETVNVHQTQLKKINLLPNSSKLSNVITSNGTSVKENLLDIALYTPYTKKQNTNGTTPLDCNYANLCSSNTHTAPININDNSPNVLNKNETAEQKNIILKNVSNIYGSRKLNKNEQAIHDLYEFNFSLLSSPKSAETEIIRKPDLEYILNSNSCEKLEKEKESNNYTQYRSESENKLNAPDNKEIYQPNENIFNELNGFNNSVSESSLSSDDEFTQVQANTDEFYQSYTYKNIDHMDLNKTTFNHPTENVKNNDLDKDWSNYEQVGNDKAINGLNTNFSNYEINEKLENSSNALISGGDVTNCNVLSKNVTNSDSTNLTMGENILVSNGQQVITNNGNSTNNEENTYTTDKTESYKFHATKMLSQSVSQELNEYKNNDIKKHTNIYTKLNKINNENTQLPFYDSRNYLIHQNMYNDNLRINTRSFENVSVLNENSLYPNKKLAVHTNNYISNDYLQNRNTLNMSSVDCNRNDAYAKTSYPQLDINNIVNSSPAEFYMYNRYNSSNKANELKGVEEEEEEKKKK